MTDSTTIDISLRPPGCLAFEQHLSVYLDGTIAPAERAELEHHRLNCAECGALVRDLEQLVHEAALIPSLAPSRDLWSGIESRLDATVVPLPIRQTGKAPRAARVGHTFSARTIAMAATLLVAVTSGITWRLARIQPQRGRAAMELAGAASPSTTPVVPPENALQRGDIAAATVPADAVVPASLVASSPADVDAIYEREITALRRVVTQRFADLDSATVADLQRNLAIIDEAIADSRRALQRNPHSRLLSSQLDRTLEAKLALMRRAAML